MSLHHTLIHTHTYLRTHLWTHTHTPMSMHTHTWTHTHTLIWTHTHSYEHTHTYLCTMNAHTNTPADCDKRMGCTFPPHFIVVWTRKGDDPKQLCQSAIFEETVHSTGCTQNLVEDATKELFYFTPGLQLAVTGNRWNGCGRMRGRGGSSFWELKKKVKKN